jgi:hypothetical protein
VPKLLLAIQDDPSFAPPYISLAACYAHMGRLDDARDIVARLRTITSVAVVVRKATALSRINANRQSRCCRVFVPHKREVCRA